MNLDHKQKLIGRLLESINEYFAVFSRPIPLRIVSWKHAKSLNHYGYGFYDVLEELQLDGTIRIELKITGGKVIYPTERKV